MIGALDDDFVDKAGYKGMVFDVFNNDVFLKVDPENGEGEYQHPVDRNGKRLMNRWTTPSVRNAVTEYKDAVAAATDGVSTALVELSDEVRAFEFSKNERRFCVMKRRQCYD